jgi:hypothetical protein
MADIPGAAAVNLAIAPRVGPQARNAERIERRLATASRRSFAAPPSGGRTHR